MSEEKTPILQAIEMLGEAERKTKHAQVLRRLKGNLLGYCPVSISTEASKRTCADGLNGWDDLMRDAMTVGCEVYANELERVAGKLANHAAAILQGRPLLDDEDRSGL